MKIRRTIPVTETFQLILDTFLDTSFIDQSTAPHPDGCKFGVG